MPRTSLFVDGFNLYHSVKDNPKHKWLDIRKLFGHIFPHLADDLTIYYFTALANWLPQSRDRHKIFIKALNSTGVRDLYGNFKIKSRHCKLCNRNYSGHEEKESDVNLAVQFVSLAYQNAYDVGIILSGDNDLCPSIKEVRHAFPERRLGVLLPVGRRANKLKEAANFHAKITGELLDASLFPDVIQVDKTTFLVRPLEWEQLPPKHCWLP